MLDACNLSKIEKLPILTSAKNGSKFESLTKALMEHHALVHVKEKAENKPWKPNNGKGWSKYARDRKHHYERKAYHAATHDDSEKDGENSQVEQA